MASILPTGEELLVTPEEILRYLNPDGLRQLLRQERLRWELKPNKDADYYSNATLFKYSGDIHNEADHLRVDTRVFPDNGANPGYAGLYIDGGEFGMLHNHDKWDHAMSDESKSSIRPTVEIGVEATHVPENESDHPIPGSDSIPAKDGYGMNPETGNVEEHSHNRTAAHVYDSYDGRAYVLSNDDSFYVNNKDRDPIRKMPGRTAARIVDIPVDLNDLDNTSNIVADWDYHHTDNSYTNSNRYVLDNLDDRTFVYPEISKNRDGHYVANKYMGLDGTLNYGEGDPDPLTQNTQPDASGLDRNGEEISSINRGKSELDDNGYNTGAYFPYVFRSFEELESVDLLRQKQTGLTHALTPNGRRRHNYYNFDGMWEYDSFNLDPKYARFDNPTMSPENMEVGGPMTQPLPYGAVQPQIDQFSPEQLHQWRYNRVSVHWYSKDITIDIAEPGRHYKVGDILRYNFLNKWIYYRVTAVGTNDCIVDGHYVQPNEPNHPNPTHGFERFDHNPSTNGVAVTFKDMISSGRDAKFIIRAVPTFDVHATQIKNNLYAYVDVVPTVQSENTLPWSDTNAIPDGSQMYTVRSTAVSPSFSGVNHGRGGPNPAPDTPDIGLYEHGGNATAGAHVHLFRYIIDTTGESYENVDGFRVYTGRWVDQGPLGIERPADIKALLFSNFDVNNFNNYYKFNLDLIIDKNRRKLSDDYAPAFIHVSNKDPWMRPLGVAPGTYPGPSQPLYESYLANGYPMVLLPDGLAEDGILDHQAFFSKEIDPDTYQVRVEEITDQVIYINAATRVWFIYNSKDREDTSYGYGVEVRGWQPVVGVIAK